jgi:hypothetical protein
VLCSWPSAGCCYHKPAARGSTSCDNECAHKTLSAFHGCVLLCVDNSIQAAQHALCLTVAQFTLFEHAKVCPLHLLTLDLHMHVSPAANAP